MENASKALLMAAGVLIGILILSLAVFLFVDFGEKTSKLYDRIEESQLLQYNAQYTIYAGRTDITIYDIISVANLAKQNNADYGDYTDFENTYKVTVVLTGDMGYTETNLQDEGITDARKQDLIKHYMELDSDGEIVHRFKVVGNRNGIDYHSNGKVKFIKFEPAT